MCILYWCYLILFSTKLGDDLSSAGIRFTGNDNPGIYVVPDVFREEALRFSFSRQRETSPRYIEKETSKISIRHFFSRETKRWSQLCRYTLRLIVHLNNFQYLVDLSRKICMRSHLRARAHMHPVNLLNEINLAILYLLKSNQKINSIKLDIYISSLYKWSLYFEFSLFYASPSFLFHDITLLTKC